MLSLVYNILNSCSSLSLEALLAFPRTVWVLNTYAIVDMQIVDAIHSGRKSTAAQDQPLGGNVLINGPFVHSKCMAEHNFRMILKAVFQLAGV